MALKATIKPEITEYGIELKDTYVKINNVSISSVQSKIKIDFIVYGSVEIGLNERKRSRIGIKQVRKIPLTDEEKNFLAEFNEIGHKKPLYKSSAEFSFDGITLQFSTLDKDTIVHHGYELLKYYPIFSAHEDILEEEEIVLEE